MVGCKPNTLLINCLAHSGRCFSSHPETSISLSFNSLSLRPNGAGLAALHTPARPSPFPPDSFPNHTGDLPQQFCLPATSGPLPAGKVRAFSQDLPHFRRTPSPIIPGTFPSCSASQLPQGHFPWGRSGRLSGKVFFSPWGPSPAVLPPNCPRATFRGEGRDIFARPSPFPPDSFPIHTGDLPQHFCLTATSGPLSVGKVGGPFGEGLLFPLGTFPSISAFQLPQAPFHGEGQGAFRGRSSFPPGDLPQHFCLPAASGPLSMGKVGALSQDLPHFRRTPSPIIPWTFPSTSTSQLPQSHFPWGRSGGLSGKVRAPFGEGQDLRQKWFTGPWPWPI